jgi:hypothetical protein
VDRKQAVAAFLGPFDMTPQDHLALSRAPKRVSATVPDWISNPPPRRHELRGADQNDRRYDLATFKPGDVIETPGADIRVRWNGSPEVKLRAGFGNGRAAGRTGPVLVPPGPIDASVDANMQAARRHTPAWFLQQVPNKQPWDYKQRSSRYEPFGNFNYGAAGRASRLPGEVLLRGAGWAQQQAGTSKPEFGNPYLGTKSFGDDPIDQYWIEQGVRYYRQR